MWSKSRVEMVASSAGAARGGISLDGLGATVLSPAALGPWGTVAAETDAMARSDAEGKLDRFADPGSVDPVLAWISTD